MKRAHDDANLQAHHREVNVETMRAFLIRFGTLMSAGVVLMDAMCSGGSPPPPHPPEASDIAPAPGNDAADDDGTPGDGA